MKEIVLEGRMLSPIFSCGAYQGQPEFRAAALKGMMRCLYRMAYPGNLKMLVQAESDLFGGMAGAGENQGHASPIQLLVTAQQSGFFKERLLRHKKDKKPLNNRPDASWWTTITIRNNKRVTVQNEMLAKIADLNWYGDLLILTLLLCGVGKRSRKGRGRAELWEQSFEEKGQSFQDETQALQWICDKLNNLAATAGEGAYYCIRENQIVPQDARRRVKAGELRPTIMKIRLGEKLRQTTKSQNQAGPSEQYYSSVNHFLCAVDQACHHWKKERNGQDKGQNLKFDPLGSGDSRFASSLLIGFIRIQDAIYPIYTFVKAVIGSCEFDQDCEQREDFIKNVMKKYNEALANE